MEPVRTILFDTVSNWPEMKRGAMPIAGPILPCRLMPDGGGSLLPALYKLIGCDLVEAASLGDVTFDLIVDEEGLLKSGGGEIAINRTWHFRYQGGALNRSYYQIWGRAIIVGVEPSEGRWRAPTLLEAIDAIDLTPDRAPDQLPRSALVPMLQNWIEDGMPWRDVVE